MNNLIVRRPRYNDAEKATLLKAYRQSNLSLKEFAAQAGLNPGTFYSWLRAQSDTTDPGSSSPMFVELPAALRTLPSSAPRQGFTVIWPNGIRLEVPGDCSVDHLLKQISLL